MLYYAGAVVFAGLVVLGLWVPFLVPKALPDDTDDLGLEQFVGNPEAARIRALQEYEARGEAAPNYLSDLGAQD